MKPIKEANRITKIWRDLGPGNYPIDLVATINEIINNSSSGDRLTIEKRPLDVLDGALVRNGPKSWCALINSNIYNAGRKNFTLAHEIGHFVGHRHLGRNFEDSTKQLHDFEVDPLEQEANEFAAQLLMPQDIIRPFTKEVFGIGELDEVAEKLAVSKQAAGLRWVKVSEKLVGFIVARDGFINWGRASDAAFSRRVFFKSGSELPLESATLAAQTMKKNFETKHGPGIWHDAMSCREYVHFGAEEFTYSCLEYFD